MHYNYCSSQYIFSFIALILTTFPSCSRALSAAAAAGSMKKVVVVGGGIQGAAVAYYLAEKGGNCQVTVLEAVQPAAAASGKGGGFMARSWGDGSPTQRLHELSFDLYETLADKLNCASYRKLPVLSVTPGYSGLQQARKDKELADMMPDWLDGKNVGRVRAMGRGDDTAQVTPAEMVEKMLAAYPDKITTVIGKCIGIETDQGSERGTRKVTGVQYQVKMSGVEEDADLLRLLAADAVIVCAGPWSCAAEDWFARTAGQSLQLPMEGIKSTSIVWKKPEDADKVVDATALFCGEDNRYGTHCEYDDAIVVTVNAADAVSCAFTFSHLSIV
jgi:glycine/D-amino acid oxidase-like deaminating enzyme